MAINLRKIDYKRINEIPLTHKELMFLLQTTKPSLKSKLYFHNKMSSYLLAEEARKNEDDVNTFLARAILILRKRNNEKSNL